MAKSRMDPADNLWTMSPRPAPLPGSARDIAQRLSHEREFVEAVLCLERALAEAGTDERAQIAADLGDVARLAGEAQEYETAQHALEVATAAVNWADLHCQLGTVHLQRGRRVEARRAFDRALTLNPRYRAAAVERALLDAREGRIGEAMETLRALVSDGTVHEPRAFEQGLGALGEAEFEDAEPLLRRGLDIGDAWLDQQLGGYQSLVDHGDMAGALERIRAAVEERPGYPDLHLLLGAHELSMGALDDAIESLSHALEVHPDYHAARVEFARALERLGDTPQALAQLALVLAQDPAHAGARTLHERLTSRRRQVRKASESLPHRA